VAASGQQEGSCGIAWYRFNWSSFVTDDVRADLADSAGLDRNRFPEEVEAALTRLFELTGGLAIAKRRHGLAARTAIARQLLTEALGHVWRGGASRRAAIPGYSITDFTDAESNAIIQATPRVPINSAFERELTSLPRISPRLAARIVAARRVRPFVNARDLADRVDGLSSTTAHMLAPRLSFAIPSVPACPPPANDWRTALGLLIERQPGADASERLMSALDFIIIRCAIEPHPDVAFAQMREFAQPAPLDVTPVERIELLAGLLYYTRLPRLIGQARDRIDVCMFHIAMPSEKHPTARVLKALGNARRRGVTVRVLVDRDRERDPYLSTIINRPAINRLQRDRIAVRVDDSDKLLHSKVIVIDDRTVVLGSHNWTAGSYFGFDDLSFLISSEEICRQQRRRFNELWRRGEPAPRRR
jgi:DNA uptake protein ComE-like DNA-binding protein